MDARGSLDACIMLMNQDLHDPDDVPRVVDARVVSPNEIQPQLLQHGQQVHPLAEFLREGNLDIAPPPQGPVVLEALLARFAPMSRAALLQDCRRARGIHRANRRSAAIPAASNQRRPLHDGLTNSRNSAMGLSVGASNKTAGNSMISCSHTFWPPFQQVASKSITTRYRSGGSGSSTSISISAVTEPRGAGELLVAILAKVSDEVK